MAEDIDKINEIFRTHDEKKKEDTARQLLDTAENTPSEDADKPAAEKTSGRLQKVDNLFINDEEEEERNYAGDELTERDYRPVRQSREYHTGCLGGLMYFVFMACVSIVFACLAWMAASDALALNKDDFTAKITLPTGIFESETVDTLDEEGNKTGTERVTTADISYVAGALKEAGLIEYKWLFEGFCKISHAELKLDAGEYELKSSYDYRALVQHMQNRGSDAVTVVVTVPEGFTMKQIFERLDEYGVADYEALEEAAANSTYKYAFLDSVTTEGAGRLEGFLFPDTYEFYVDMQASSAINKFLQVFYNKLSADMQKQAQDRGMTIEQIVTIASLIEKEAANDSERATIASVIYNRLDAGMSLGLESAILYVHPEHEGAPTPEMLEEDSPYNLNVKTGLPPTPICNPGLASIEAALNPEYTGYYYFYYDSEAEETRFFTNYNEFANFAAAH